MKTLIYTAMVLGLVSCDSENNKNTTIEERKANIDQQYREIGLPQISNFYEKRMLKQIIEMRDDANLINYFYTKNVMTGKWIYEGKCIGFGIPYTTRYSSRYYEQAHGTRGGGYTTINAELPESNGLFNDGSTTATWVIKLDDKGNRSIEYVESEIRVTQQKIGKHLIETWSLPEDY